MQDKYIITSNRESGFGRYDVVLKPRDIRKKAMILEFKVKETEEEILPDKDSDLLFVYEPEPAKMPEAAQIPAQPIAGQPLQNQPLPGQPLHNPLPVPKKHQKKNLDFQKDIEEKDLHFDIEVKEEDDFDH